jgi:hypothetical protein
MLMKTTALLLSLLVVPVFGQLSMRRTSLLPAGIVVTVSGKVLCFDCDHDGVQELVFRTGFGYPLRWEIWEYRPVNRYELVYADTGVYPYPTGIATGNLVPFDIGDIDQDGRTDIVGVNRERANDTLYNVLVVMESPDHHLFPDSLVWSFRYGRNLGGNAPCYVAPDLDRDRKLEIALLGGGQYIGLGIWEPAGDNRYDLVWNSWDVPSMTSLMFGDFDLDSLREFAGGWSLAGVYENTLPGQDSYLIVYCDTTGLGNGNDGFSAQDLDQDGWPEFLISFHSYSANTFFLNMWEATGNNTFERTLVDERRMVVGYGGGRSRCGDLDGDGVGELAWALPLGLFVYKAVGNNEFEQVWEWWDDHGGTGQSLITNIADMNRNGYNELVVGGSGKTSVFEVEAIRVLHPDTSEEFCPGDTCLVRWQTFTPPRCDSVSLFLLTDTVVPEGEWFYQLDAIVTGLSSTDSVYPWVVPDTVLEAAWIVAIAYGPGWQFDRSDSAFAIHPVGMAGRPKPIALGPFPEPTIVGGMLWLGPDLGHDPDSPDGIGSCPASLLDITGRKVLELQPGDNDIRHLAPGVYFVRRPTTEDGRPRTSVRKVVIQH